MFVCIRRNPCRAISSKKTGRKTGQRPHSRRGRMAVFRRLAYLHLDPAGARIVPAWNRCNKSCSGNKSFRFPFDAHGGCIMLKQLCFLVFHGSGSDKNENGVPEVVNLFCRGSCLGPVSRYGQITKQIRHDREMSCLWHAPCFAGEATEQFTMSASLPASGIYIAAPFFLSSFCVFLRVGAPVFRGAVFPSTHFPPLATSVKG